jgi:N-acetylglucosaminyldiphosphoundecaprenol N-acetyl-beta-D-mannosaminyltransferase
VTTDSIFPARTRTLGIDVDPLTLDQATTRICAWLSESHTRDRPCRYVVTPNLDHAVQLGESEPLRAAYRDAALVLSDGMPLIWASRLLRRGIPERVAGSDLGPQILDQAPAGTRVYFLGASEEASQRAVEVCREKFPQVEVVGRLSPPRGFEQDPEWSRRILSEINETRAQLVIVGLGAPKQELWTHAHFKQMPGTVVLCIGATIDFIAGAVSRAPIWMQRSGLEWVHRLLSQPGRLASRYAKDAVFFPVLLARDALSGYKPAR